MLCLSITLQRTQPSKNFPWFFKLDSQFQRTASREHWISFCHSSTFSIVFSHFFFSCWGIFNKPKQANQAKFSEGSSSWIHHFNIVHLQKVRKFERFLIFVAYFDGLYVDVFSKSSNKPTKWQFPAVLLAKQYWSSNLYRYKILFLGPVTFSNVSCLSLCHFGYGTKFYVQKKKNLNQSDLLFSFHTIQMTFLSMLGGVRWNISWKNFEGHVWISTQERRQ